jgi:hypothetical protein
MARHAALPLLLSLVPASSAPPAWRTLGAPLAHARVVAVSVAHGAAPLVAYGASDAPGDTTTRVLAYAGGAWALVGSHTPQFAQPYEHFDLVARGAALSIGLVINPSDGAAAGLSSILRNSSGGSPDGFEGAYAFAGSVWSFDVAADGSARVAVSPDNASLALTTYAARGWDSYPATDAWSPLVTVETPAGGVAAVAAARDANETLFVAWAERSGAVGAGATPLGGASAAWASLGAPFVAMPLLLPPASNLSAMTRMCF